MHVKEKKYALLIFCLLQAPVPAAIFGELERGGRAMCAEQVLSSQHCFARHPVYQKTSKTNIFTHSFSNPQTGCRKHAQCTSKLTLNGWNSVGIGCEFSLKEVVHPSIIPSEWTIHR